MRTARCSRRRNRLTHRKAVPPARNRRALAEADSGLSLDFVAEFAADFLINRAGNAGVDADEVLRFGNDQYAAHLQDGGANCDAVWALGKKTCGPMRCARKENRDEATAVEM